MEISQVQMQHAVIGHKGLRERERVYRTKYPTLDAAKADVFDYIELFYNSRMRRRVAKQDLKISAVLKLSVVSG